MKDFIYKLNYYYIRLIQELAYATSIPVGRPTGALILLTNRCNARCLHCHSWKRFQNGEEIANKEMTTALWKAVLEELREWLGPAFISMTGGETLLREDAIDLAQYAAHLGFWVEFLTNGYLLDSPKAVRLIRSGIRRIKISLDGSRPEIHDAVRGRKGFFEKATWSLRTLADERNKSNRDIEIWAKTAIMSLNAEDLPLIVMLTKELDLNGVEFQALEPVYYSNQLGDPDWYRDNPLWITDLKTLSYNIQRLKELKTKGYPILNSLDNLSMIENYFVHPDQLAFKVHTHEYSKKKNVCRSHISGLQIMPDGGIKMCHWMKPFANAQNRNIRMAWEKRPQCWRNTCSYLDSF